MCNRLKKEDKYYYYKYNILIHLNIEENPLHIHCTTIAQIAQISWLTDAQTGQNLCNGCAMVVKPGTRVNRAKAALPFFEGALDGIASGCSVFGPGIGACAY